MKIYTGVIKGIAIAAFLIAIGVVGFSPEWWVAMVALNIIASG